MQCPEDNKRMRKFARAGDIHLYHCKHCHRTWSREGDLNIWAEEEQGHSFYHTGCPGDERN